VRTCVSNRDADPLIQKLFHTVGVLCIDYYEACQRKNRADSWNDCHSRVEVSRQHAQQKSCWGFVHALLELAAWLQAGEDRAIAAGSKADKKSGCRPLGPLFPFSVFCLPDCADDRGLVLVDGCRFLASFLGPGFGVGFRPRLAFGV
jgi:hypothetical protein